MQYRSACQHQQHHNVSQHCNTVQPANTSSSTCPSTAIPFSLPTSAAAQRIPALQYRSACQHPLPAAVFTNTKEQRTKEAQRENRKRDAMGNSVIEIGMPDT
jgi:hypothetical protein